MTDDLPDTNVGNIEYIRKQDALDAFGLSEKTRKYGGDHSGYDTRMLYEIHDALTGSPAEDVVQVVRCKDCKHHAYDEIFSCYWCEYPGRVRDTTPDGFCEKGEE